MRVRDVGEFGLIGRIERLASLASPAPGRRVVLGIGDDAALVRPRAGEDLVVTTDAHVEDVHFRFEKEPARAIGRRALVANLSDLAAMGAAPAAFTLSLATPASLPLRTALDLVRGMVTLGAECGAPLVGGNVARAREVQLHVTALGTVRRGRALRRDAARAGDRVFVTGTLGGPALRRARALQRGSQLRERPEPRLAAGRALARLGAVGACIDVSDGLAADLLHVTSASGVGAWLDPAAVPRPRGFASGCRRLGLDPLETLLGGGEDYELLFTVRPRGPGTAALARRLGVPVAAIGRITAEPGLALEGPPGDKARPVRGFRHF